MPGPNILFLDIGTQDALEARGKLRHGEGILLSGIGGDAVHDVQCGHIQHLDSHWADVSKGRVSNFKSYRNRSLSLGHDTDGTDSPIPPRL